MRAQRPRPRRRIRSSVRHNTLEGSSGGRPLIRRPFRPVPKRLSTQGGWAGRAVTCVGVRRPGRTRTPPAPSRSCRHPTDGHPCAGSDGSERSHYAPVIPSGKTPTRGGRSPPRGVRRARPVILLEARQWVRGHEATGPRPPSVEVKRRAVLSSPEVKSPPLPNDRERTMADIARQGRKAFAFNGHESGTRHPLVAAAMVLPWPPSCSSSSEASTRWRHRRRPLA